MQRSLTVAAAALCGLLLIPATSSAATTCRPLVDDASSQVAPHLQLVRAVVGNGTCPSIQIQARTRSGAIWGTDSSGGLWRSANELKSWTLVYRMQRPNGEISHVLPLRSGRVLVVTTDSSGIQRVFRSSGTGSRAFSKTPSLAFPRGATLHGSPSWSQVGKTIYVGEYGDRPNPVTLWKSTNEGVSFRPVFQLPGYGSGDPYPARHIHDVLGDPFDSKRIWLTVGDRPGSRIGYSDDGGHHFTFISEVTYPQSRAVDLMFTRDAVYWGTDSADARGQLWRWDRASGQITLVLSGIAGPWYDAAQYRGLSAQFSTVPVRTSPAYVDEFAHVLTAGVGGQGWTDTALPWKRDPARAKTTAIQQRITQPDFSGRFWVGYSNLVDSKGRRVVALEFQLGEPSDLRACVVPKLHRLRLSTAKARLRAANCGTGRVVRRRSSHAGRGRVISQSPSAGKTRKPRFPVRLTVSKGR